MARSIPVGVGLTRRHAVNVMDWPEWLALFLRSAPSAAQADVVRKRPEAFRAYWEQGYSPDHAWQEEDQMGFGPIPDPDLPDVGDAIRKRRERPTNGER